MLIFKMVGTGFNLRLWKKHNFPFKYMLVTEKQPKSVNFINSVQTLFHDMFIFCYFVALMTFIIYYY